VKIVDRDFDLTHDERMILKMMAAFTRVWYGGGGGEEEEEEEEEEMRINMHCIRPTWNPRKSSRRSPDREKLLSECSHQSSWM
jgi:hypothetical protein